MADKLLFEYKAGMGLGLWVYEDKVVICNRLGNKTTIPINKIAAVSLNLVGNVEIETTGGKSFGLLCGKKGAQAKEIIDGLIL